MILDETQILQILKTNPAKNTLNLARQKAAILKIHITGENLKDAITQMPDFEDDQKKNIRQKYSRSNKDLFARLHRPIDKVFRAKGGSITYNMPDNAQKPFASYIANIRNGMSLRKWIQMVALPAFQIDPMGLIYMEIDKNLGKDGKQQPYPTYKSTSDIFDYLLNGRKLEYVIFKLSDKDSQNIITTGVELPSQQQSLLDKLKSKLNTARWYRVVDDTTDKIIEWDGQDQISEVAGLSIPNYFMQVPALIISDIVNYNSEIFLSPDNDIVELANDFLTDCSVFNIWKKKHGFPKQWRVRSVCPSCMGTGKQNGSVCPDCGGTAYNKRSSVRDEIVIPMPTAEDGSSRANLLPTKVYGFETPDIEGWDKMVSEMERLEELMHVSLYGTCSNQKTNGPATKGQQTATEAIMDVQSMNERLDDFREWGQTLETFVIDLSGQLQYGSAYKGVSDNWGNRYIIEGPDVIWEKYKNARSAGAPQATLDGLLRDYYESRYSASPLDLAKALILMKVEPWTHATIQQVEMMSVTDIDRAAKTYFSEWVSTIDDMHIIMGDPDTLRDELYAYVTPKSQTISAEALAEANLQPAKALNERVTT